MKTLDEFQRITVVSMDIFLLLLYITRLKEEGHSLVIVCVDTFDVVMFEFPHHNFKLLHFYAHCDIISIPVVIIFFNVIVKL